MLTLPPIIFGVSDLDTTFVRLRAARAIEWQQALYHGRRVLVPELADRWDDHGDGSMTFRSTSGSTYRVSEESCTCGGNGARRRGDIPRICYHRGAVAIWQAFVGGENAVQRRAREGLGLLIEQARQRAA